MCVWYHVYVDIIIFCSLLYGKQITCRVVQFRPLNWILFLSNCKQNGLIMWRFGGVSLVYLMWSNICGCIIIHQSLNSVRKACLDFFVLWIYPSLMIPKEVGKSAQFQYSIQFSPVICESHVVNMGWAYHYVAGTMPDIWHSSRTENSWTRKDRTMLYPIRECHIQVPFLGGT